MFARSVRLLRLGGMWPPPSAAPEGRRRRYAAYSAALGAFVLANALGEVGGMLRPGLSLQARCANLNSSLWRLLAFAVFTQFHRHAAAIQALVAEAERLARLQHGDHGPEHVRHQVEALQERAHRIINRIIVVYMCWFTYSSTGVVSQPAVDWLVSGVRPTPFLSTNFWLVVAPDTPFREAAMYASQTVCQYACTVVVVSYITFVTGLTLFLSFQAKILGVLVRAVPYPACTSAITPDPRAERRARGQLVHCIVFHQDILKVAMEVNRVVRLMVMILFMIALGFIATMIFQISVMHASGLLMATVMILICSNSQVGVFCYSSDRLSMATEEVVHHVMASDWALGPASMRGLLPLMLARANKAPKLWCWKVFAIGLPTWLQVLNKSYSVYAVMRSSDK